MNDVLLMLITFEIYWFPRYELLCWYPKFMASRLIQYKVILTVLLP